jgi:hypothetical protein
MRMKKRSGVFTIYFDSFPVNSKFLPLYFNSPLFVFIFKKRRLLILVCGHVDLFDILIEYQASIHTADIYGAFPIHYASQLCGNDDAVKGSMNI